MDNKRKNIFLIWTDPEVPNATKIKILKKYGISKMLRDNYKLFQNDQDAFLMIQNNTSFDIILICSGCDEIFFGDCQDRFFSKSIHSIIVLSQNWRYEFYAQNNKTLIKALKKYHLQIQFIRNEELLFKEMLPQLYRSHLKIIRQKQKIQVTLHKINNLEKMGVTKTRENQKQWSIDEFEVISNYIMLESKGDSMFKFGQTRETRQSVEIVFGQSNISIFHSYYQSYKGKGFHNHAYHNNSLHNLMAKKNIEEQPTMATKILDKLMNMASQQEVQQIKDELRTLKESKKLNPNSYIHFMMCFVYLYTGNAVYKQFNRQMREQRFQYQNQIIDFVAKGWKNFLSQKGDQIKKLPSQYRTGLIYRGIDLIKEQETQQKMFEWFQFSSCSTQDYYAQKFLDYGEGSMYQIALSNKEQYNFIVMELLGDICQQKEKQILLFPGFKGKIFKIKWKNDQRLKLIQCIENEEGRQTSEIEISKISEKNQVPFEDQFVQENDFQKQ